MQHPQHPQHDPPHDPSSARSQERRRRRSAVRNTIRAHLPQIPLPPHGLPPNHHQHHQHHQLPQHLFMPILNEPQPVVPLQGMLRAYPIYREGFEDCGGIILPQHYLEICVDRLENHPMILELVHGERRTHVSLLEFSDDEPGVVYLPRWVMKTLEVREGDLIQMHEIMDVEHDVPQVNRVVIKPEYNDFRMQENPLEIMQEYLNHHFHVISVGTQLLPQGFPVEVIQLLSGDRPVQFGRLSEGETELIINPSKEFDEWEELYFQRQLTLLSEMQTQELSEQQQLEMMQQMAEEQAQIERGHRLGESAPDQLEAQVQLMRQLHQERMNRMRDSH